MNRTLLLVLVGGGSALLLGSMVAAPHALRGLETFRVQRVEVRGTRFLAPHEALQQSGIAKGASIFDNAQPWLEALERHPLIERARVERVLPGTLLLYIEEAEPIALVSGASAGDLRAVTTAGELLPLDPTRFVLDLPVLLTTARPTAAAALDSAQVSLLQVLQHMRTLEPVLFGWISDIEAAPGGARIRLRSPAGAFALVPLQPDALRLRQLRLTLADLAARNDIGRLVRVDARFQGQIVVSLTSTVAG